MAVLLDEGLERAQFALVLVADAQVPSEEPGQDLLLQFGQLDGVVVAVDLASCDFEIRF